MIRGYHVYKDVWSSFIEEVPYCCRDVHNHHNPFAVAMCKGTTAVGHMPKKSGSLASATAFETSMFASAIDTVGTWSDKGPFGSDCIQAAKQKCSLF